MRRRPIAPLSAARTVAPERLDELMPGPGRTSARLTSSRRDEPNRAACPQKIKPSELCGQKTAFHRPWSGRCAWRGRILRTAPLGAQRCPLHHSDSGQEIFHHRECTHGRQCVTQRCATTRSASIVACRWRSKRLMLIGPLPKRTIHPNQITSWEEIDP
jgi:hypothetical protein